MNGKPKMTAKEVAAWFGWQAKLLRRQAVQAIEQTLVEGENGGRWLTTAQIKKLAEGTQQGAVAQAYELAADLVRKNLS